MPTSFRIAHTKYEAGIKTDHHVFSAAAGVSFAKVKFDEYKMDDSHSNLIPKPSYHSQGLDGSQPHFR